MEFTTARLLLRDYSEGDREQYFKLMSDEKTMYYLQDIQIVSQDQADRKFNEVLADQTKEDRTFYFFHLELKETHEQLGSIGYTVTDATPVGKLVHAGYFIFPEFWNRGYVTEAFQEVIRFAFEENDVYRITTGCFAENAGSEKVMKKCGLIKEAEHVNCEWHDGRLKTRVEYRLLKEEWNQGNGKS